MKRCVIIGGAEIKDPARIRAELSNNDFFIYCDSGTGHISVLGFAPDLIIGDFDSSPDPKLDVETITLPCEKDDTDTAFAAKEALRRGFRDFLLIGVTGGRLDHTMGNLALLTLLSSRGASAKIIDDYSEISLVTSKARVNDSFAFFSLLPAGGPAFGVTITGAKYPVSEKDFPTDDPFGVSNEVIKGSVAEITVKEGALWLIKVFEG